MDGNFEAMPLIPPLPSLYFTAFKGDIPACLYHQGCAWFKSLGIIFNAGGTAGGTDILARIFNKYTSLSMGKLMLIVDTIVLTTVVCCLPDVRTTMPPSSLS